MIRKQQLFAKIWDKQRLYFTGEERSSDIKGLAQSQRANEDRILT